MVVFKTRDSVPSPRYSPVCNVLRQWKTSLIPTLKACLHCGKMNPDPIRIKTGSVVSGSDVVRLRPHCNNRIFFIMSEHHVQPRVPSAWRVAHARAALINFE